jgi:16S rRNA (cytosine1402-N4)-methyltransferase
MSASKRPDSRADRAFDPYHVPVLLAETVAVLAADPGRTIVDGTLGGSGHTRALLAAGAKIIGLDQDENAIGYCIQHLVRYDGDSVRLIQANFRDLPRVLDHLNMAYVDGILLDLGVSSHQIDQAERGFSFQQAGPLDMRMNRSRGTSAADVVNQADEHEMTQLFRLYGEEPCARAAAAAIVAARRTRPFTETLELARLLEKVIPKRGPRHPATRVFQALRMAVNDELGALRDGLEAAAQRLRPGGRLAVLTFHSLEDRIVKSFCRETSREFDDRPEWPAPRPNPRCMFRAVTRKALQPSAAETSRNPRARSAKLRALERTAAPYRPSQTSSAGSV